MSGHSKWSQIKRQKQLGDQKRGLLFGKLANSITLAVKQGGGITNPETNFKLRLVIERARAANMPKENVKRAIERASGEDGGTLEEVLYEGYGPAGVAIIVEVVTDNRVRTSQEIKVTFDHGGGHMVSPGAVARLFTSAGLITVEKGDRSYDEILDIVVESGATDLERTNSLIEVYTEPDKLSVVKEKLKERELTIKDVELVFRPLTLVSITDLTFVKKVVTLVAKLEEIPEVVKVYANFDIPDYLLTQIGNRGSLEKFNP